MGPVTLWIWDISTLNVYFLLVIDPTPPLIFVKLWVGSFTWGCGIIGAYKYLWI